MGKNRLILTLGLILLASQLSAQFSLSGELRPRAEYRHGFLSLVGPDDKAAFFISQRSRLNFGYDHSDVKFFISLQDVRVWGDVVQLNRSDASSSVHEAWAEVPFDKNVSIKVGRQEIIYDDSRIFGNVDWAQQGRSHDLALLKLKPSSQSNIHIGLAFNQESERRISTFYGLQNYKTMQYAWFNFRPGSTNLSLLFLNQGLQYATDKTVFNQTSGAYILQNFGNSSLSGSAYLQTGQDRSNRDLSAYYLAAEGIFNLNENWKFRPGFEWISGTDQTNLFDPGFGKNKSFTPFFGTNHKFNGHMDYFYVGNHLDDVGLRNPYLAFDYKKEKLLGMVALHGFWSDGEVIDLFNSGQTMNSYLGTEVDLIFGYNPNPTVAFRIGYSHMFASETMERLKGGSKDETQNWLWAMLIIKPKFI